MRDIKKQRLRQLEYYHRNKEKYKIYKKQHELELRKSVMRLLGGIKCVNCGCDDMRVLEINHKKGGGAQDYKRGVRGERIVRYLLSGKLNLADFDVMCKICNAFHYIQSKHGLARHQIIWK